MAKVNESALKYGVLTIEKSYHEQLLQLYPSLGSEGGTVHLKVILADQTYESQLYLQTSKFGQRWKRASLNIRIHISRNLIQYFKENSKIGDNLHLTFIAVDPPALHAILKRK